MAVVRHDQGPPPPPTRETQARAQAAWDRVLEPHPVQYPPTGLRCLVGSHADLLPFNYDDALSREARRMTTRRRVEFYLHPALRGSRWAPVYRYWPILVQVRFADVTETSKLRQLGPGHNITPAWRGSSL